MTLLLAASANSSRFLGKSKGLRVKVCVCVCVCVGVVASLSQQLLGQVESERPQVEKRMKRRRTRQRARRRRRQRRRRRRRKEKKERQKEQKERTQIMLFGPQQSSLGSATARPVRLSSLTRSLKKSCPVIMSVAVIAAVVVAGLRPTTR